MTSPKNIIIDFPSIAKALGTHHKETDIHFAIINTLHVCLADVYSPLGLYQLNNRRITHTTLDDVKDTLSYYSFRYAHKDEEMKTILGQIVDKYVDVIYSVLAEVLVTVDPKLTGYYRATQAIGGLYVLTRA